MATTAPKLAAPSRTRKWVERVVKALATAYLVGLLATALTFHWIGERWWVTAVGLYVPRVVFAAPLPIVIAGVAWLRQRWWLWAQAPSVLLLVFPILGFVPPWPRFGGSGPALRILSYNVNSAAGGVDRVIAEVERFSPDVVLMQEISAFDVLEPALRASYPTVVHDNQFILATRFPLQQQPSPDPVMVAGRSHSPRFVRYLLQSPLGAVTIYNVHPISPRDGLDALHGQGLRQELLSGRLFRGAAASVIESNAELRAAQVRAFATAAAAESGPVIIAGDTNLPGLSPLLENLSRFHDGFADAGWGLGYTYPNDNRLWMRIDRIFTNDALRFVDFQVGQSKASDHLCVFAEIKKR
jgi:endonuclease/exonuclease/phosphatase (EEP) superfamily protein YafD